MRILTASILLPFTVIEDEGNFQLRETSEGLATGVSSFLRSKSTLDADFLWFGAPNKELPKNSERVQELLTKNRIVPVNLRKEIKEFSEHFCNKTIWPLFHYFSSKTSYDAREWRSYLSMNETFCDSIRKNLRPGDLIWIQDYHLMLLPQMLRKIVPHGIPIGFFLNIPFPAYEVFRQLPSGWSVEILSGLLGSDLIGFQTDGYVQSFNRCVGRLLSYNHQNDRIYLSHRTVQIGAFAAGIDFERFHHSSLQPNVALECNALKKSFENKKLILSVDRLDYSKGILNRLMAYEKFLETNKFWHKKVTLFSVVAPSRAKDEQYLSMKKQIDGTVGRINGKFGSFEWNPVVYHYRFLPFEKLAALYNYSDVLLVTPLREGMNLIAKEYIASRRNQSGVLVLSEMAGAAKELTDAILVNPNDIDAIVNSIQRALLLPPDEQVRRMERMQSFIKSNDVFHWADSFLNALTSSTADQKMIPHKEPSVLQRPQILKKFRRRCK